MFPSRFRYEAPRTLEEAFDLLDSSDESKVLAGGQSLVPMLKLRFASPDLLVDINRLPDLAYHRVDSDGSIHIGALTRHADMEHSALIAAKQPTLAAVAPLVADPLVRNRGTLVGSLCHADPQGDWAAAFISLGGHVVAAGPNGKRTIQMTEFVTGPFSNALGHDEIAVEAVIPAPQGVPMGGYLKLERRVGDFATAAVAISLDLAGGKVTRAGVALAGVGGSTINCPDAAAALVGGGVTQAAAERAAALAAEAAQPKTDHRGSVEFKRHIVHTFVMRILRQIATSSERAA